METKFKLIFEGKLDLEIEKFRLSLPKSFSVVEEDDGFYMTVQSGKMDENQCQYLVDRELDRHFFLTSVKIKAQIIRKTVTGSLTLRHRIHGHLPDKIGPQNWDYKLPVQLRLWSIAVDSSEIQTKLILLYQIIELAYPDGNFPEYTDSTIAPDPLTECKLVRHLIAHSGDVKHKRLKLYCEHIGLPEIMLDITDPHYFGIISAKVSILEAEAKKVIESAL